MDSDKNNKQPLSGEEEEMETIPLDPVGKGKPITYRFSTTANFKAYNQATSNNLSDSQEVISDCCFCRIS